MACGILGHSVLTARQVTYSSQTSEINVQPASSKGGENYGWKFMCGSHPFPMILTKNPDGTETAKDPENFPKVGVYPIAEYSHVDQGICVINLGVYRGKEFPELDGVYFAADWGSGKVWGMKQVAGNGRCRSCLISLMAFVRMDLAPVKTAPSTSPREPLVTAVQWIPPWKSAALFGKSFPPTKCPRGLSSHPLPPSNPLKSSEAGPIGPASFFYTPRPFLNS